MKLCSRYHVWTKWVCTQYKATTGTTPPQRAYLLAIVFVLCGFHKVAWPWSWFGWSHGYTQYEATGDRFRHCMMTVVPLHLVASFAKHARPWPVLSHLSGWHLTNDWFFVPRTYGGLNYWELSFRCIINFVSVCEILLHTFNTSQDYTLDFKVFCELPEVSNSSCPKAFLEVAFNCCKVS